MLGVLEAGAEGAVVATDGGAVSVGVDGAVVLECGPRAHTATAVSTVSPTDAAAATTISCRGRGGL
ncbi:MAG TPA: hypothetical protein VN180_13655 [Acidimicrobiia bacterium]|nr:hypothetical protein [Acidimicrobiia bacterium]